MLFKTKENIYMEQLLSESKNMKKINSISYMKLLFALLVISIHTKPFLDINGNLSNIICEIIAKLAVPFFFLLHQGTFILTR